MEGEVLARQRGDYLSLRETRMKGKLESDIICRHRVGSSVPCCQVRVSFGKDDILRPHSEQAIGVASTTEPREGLL